MSTSTYESEDEREQKLADQYAQEEYEELCSALQDLETYCKSLGMDCRFDEENDPYVFMAIPCGRQSEAIFVNDASIARRLIGTPLSSVRLLENYHGFFLPSEKYVEVLVSHTAGFYNEWSRFLETFEEDEETRSAQGTGAPQSRFHIPPPREGRHKGADLSFGRSSTLFQGLLSERSGLFGSVGTIQLKGIQAESVREFERAVEQIAAPIVLQLDLLFGIPCMLPRYVKAPEPETAKQARPISRRASFRDLVFPSSRYDMEPVFLYWYARSAERLPLLQFLAYYQVVEYYFPRYAQEDAKKRVHQVLVSPDFNPHRDDHVLKVLDAIRNSDRAAFGDERYQLKTTLDACVREDDIRGFLDAKGISEYLTGKVWDKVSKVKVLVNNRGSDLRHDVADRLYDIRCKIVHTKRGGGREELPQLLPFSSEASLVNYDIAIMQWVAQRVLFGGATPLEV